MLLANKEGARLCDSCLGNESSKPVSLLLIVASLGLGTRLGDCRSRAEGLWRRTSEGCGYSSCMHATSAHHPAAGYII